MTGNDPWDSGLPYERFMGRWSRRISPQFLTWLKPADGLRWLDLGCGTGQLSFLIAGQCRPQEVLGVDPSAAFIAHAARAALDTPALRFEVGSADHIPAADHHFDIVVSALALNFFPDVDAGLREMSRVLKPGGDIAAYIWDYAEGMQMLRLFWDVALQLDPAALPHDEGVRFPICRPDTLRLAFRAAGLHVHEIRSLETPTVFQDFDDYWQPFLGNVGAAPGYVTSLQPDHRAELESRLRAALPSRPDGSIPLSARAWAVRARS